MNYEPHPLDTSNIALPPELEALSEKIAANVHEVWAVSRLQDGWTYGKTRDDEKKQTPCLVPYGQLSEGEKEYDRRTAMETIKMILALGFRIEKD